MKWKLISLYYLFQKQCLGFWSVGSGSAKICGSTDPDPWFLNGSSSFSIKIGKKIKEFEHSALLKNFSKFYENNPDPDPFFSSADPGSGSASKLNGS